MRYLLIGGLTFLFFYAWRRRRSWAPKIQPNYPPSKEIGREFFYSLISIGIFALTTVGIVLLKHSGYTRVYYDVSKYEGS